MAPSTILVVDKFREARELVRDILHSAGYRCLLAGDGLEAMDVIRRERPELVITGIRIPIVNGIELLRHIRDKAPDIGVLILTSDAAANAATCRALGAYKVLEKPVYMDELLILVKGALEHRQLLIEGRRLAGR